MKLKRGKKPEQLNIAIGVSHTIITTGDYIEIDIKDPIEIAKLRSKGFTTV